MATDKKKLTIEYLVRESTRIEDAKGHKITWPRRDSGADLNPMEALAMIHEETDEVQREYRDNNIVRFGAELASVILRCCHLAGDLGIDLEQHLREELKFNETRPFRHGRPTI